MKTNTKRMMVLLVGVPVIAAMVYSHILLAVEKKTHGDLSLQNVEALADDEYHENVLCYGTGNIQCPDGRQVSLVYAR